MTRREITPSIHQHHHGVSLVADRIPILDVLLATGELSSREALRALSARQVQVGTLTITDPASLIAPWRQSVLVRGRPLGPLRRCRYIVLYKPYRVLCAFTDLEGRSTLADYVPMPDIYPVGRLDYDSEGLLLLTDDGWLNHRLAHPRYEHPKTYLAQVEGRPSEGALERLRSGVMVEGRRTLPADVEIVSDEALPPLPARSVPVRYRATVPTTWLRLDLREGAKRQVRHMTAAVGLPTLRLVRIAIGPLRLDIVDPGQWRDLTAAELSALRQSLAAERSSHPPHASARLSRQRASRTRRPHA